MVFHYLQKLVDHTNEEIIVSEVFKLIEILFAPDQIIYEPSGTTAETMTYRPEISISDYNADSSFEIKIIYSKEPIGTFGIVGVKFPEYIPRYKEMTNILSHMAGLAISNARKYSQLENAKTLISNSESRFRSMFLGAPIGVSLIDSHTGQIIESNPQFNNITGRHSDDLTNIDWMQITHPDDIGEDLNNMELFNAGKIPGYQMEKRFILPDGSLVWVDMAIVKFNSNDVSGKQHICMIQDISIRKEIELKLLESEAKYKGLSYKLEAIIDHIPGFLFYKDKENNFIRVNKNLAESYKISKSELEGKNLKDLHSEDDAEKYLKDDLEVINTGIPKLNIEVLWEVGDDYRWLNTSKIPFKNDQGEIIGVIGISMDITDKKKSETQILRTNEKLKTAIAEKDKFFSIISHDLRSPLASVVSLLELMSENFSDFPPKEIHRFINTSYKTSHSLFNLLENLLEWSRMQRGVMPFKPEFYELKQLVGDCEPSTFEMAQKKNIELDIDIPEGLMVYADSHMLHSIMRNIVTNALKFTHEGGMIMIKANSTEDGDISISIRDNGIGMSEEILNKLFRLDANISRPGTNKEHSSGLGLLLCKEFVEKHGGTLIAESKENEGSCFCFVLPKKRS